MAVGSEESLASSVKSAALLQRKLLQLVDEAAIQRVGDASPAEKLRLLTDSTPLFSELRVTSRSIHDASRHGKRKVAEVRSDVDERSLALQNLKYKKRHLEEEIRMCRDFRSIYQTIQLTDLEDFRARAPAEDTTNEITSDAHSLQLARLRFELSERKRLEAEKQSIQAQRGSLIKENKEKKQRLEGLERDLKDMLSKSDIISQRFEPPKDLLQSGPDTQVASTPIPTDAQG